MIDNYFRNLNYLELHSLGGQTMNNPIKNTFFPMKNVKTV